MLTLKKKIIIIIIIKVLSSKFSFMAYCSFFQTIFTLVNFEKIRKRLRFNIKFIKKILTSFLKKDKVNKLFKYFHQYYSQWQWKNVLNPKNNNYDDNIY